MAEDDLAVIQVLLTQIDNMQVNFGFKSISGVEPWRQIVLDGFAVLMVPIIMSGLSEDVFLTDLRMVDVVPGTAEDEVHTFVTPPQGQVSGDAVPQQLAGKIVWRTELAGRSFRGSSYIPGKPLSHLASTPGTWLPAGVSHLNNIRNGMVDAYGTDGTSTFGRFVVISRWENGEARVPPIGTVVDGGYIQLRARTQRRRVHQ